MKFPIVNETDIILESVQSTSAPKILDEIEELEKDIKSNFAKDLHVPKDVLDSFLIKDTLNPEIWDNGKLNPKVSGKLIQIARDFFRDMEINQNVKIKDIIFTGSLANYNWSKFSDIDLHIVLDFSQFDAKEELVKNYFYAFKVIWNQEHDVRIFDYPVELYIQNIHDKLAATAVYSVLRDKWIVKPTREKFKIDKAAIKDKSEKIIYLLKDIKQEYQDKHYKEVVEKVIKLKKKIKQMRNAGLEKGGEFSLENLVFKVLRRTPFMDQLDSYKNKAYDNLMSVHEVLNEEPQFMSGGILMIRGPKGSDGTSRLFVTHVKSIMSVDRLKKDDSKGATAKMAILGNPVYRIIQDNDKLTIKPVAWSSDMAILKALGLNGNKVVLNNHKTPLHWDSLKYNDYNRFLSAMNSGIMFLDKIRWIN